MKWKPEKQRRRKFAREKATEILNSAQELLDELQASRNIEGHQLIVVDVEVRSQYDKSILILQRR